MLTPSQAFFIFSFFTACIMVIHIGAMLSEDINRYGVFIYLGFILLVLLSSLKTNTNH